MQLVQIQPFDQRTPREIIKSIEDRGQVLADRDEKIESCHTSGYWTLPIEKV
jgi:hypothetical protein